MIETVMFDYGGVLGSDSDPDGRNYSKILEITGLSTEEMVVIFDKHWSSLKLGQEKAEKLWQEVVIHSRKPVTVKELSSAQAAGQWLNKGVLAFARSLKNKVRLAILSNEAKEWMDAKVKKFGLKKIFEKIYCSAELGLAKPDPAIFKYVLNDLGVTGDKVLFIDNLERNLQIAAGLKMQTLLFQNASQLAQVYPQ